MILQVYDLARDYSGRTTKIFFVLLRCLNPMTAKTVKKDLIDLLLENTRLLALSKHI